MTTGYTRYPKAGATGGGVPTYANFTAFPAGTTVGQLGVAQDTGLLYEWRGSAWEVVAGPGAALSIGAFGSTPNANGLSLSSNVLTMQPADATHPGGLSVGAQTIGGDKTLTGTLDVTPSAANKAALILHGVTSQSERIVQILDYSGALGVGISAEGSLEANAGFRITNPITMTAAAPAAPASEYYLGVKSFYIGVQENGGGPGLSTIYLPYSPVIGQIIIVKDESGFASQGNITINGAGSTIDGASTLVINVDYGFVTLNYKGGGKWETWTNNTKNFITVAAAGASGNASGASISNNTLTLQKADATHPGVVANIGSANGVATLDANGLVPITQLPPAAIERLVIVADQTARYALTTATVQNGDTVLQSDISEMFFVKDDTNLGNSAGYQVYVAGTAASVAWSGITSIPTPVTNLSGTNTGDISIGAVGSVPNANGVTLTGQALTLQPADGTYPGIVSINAQTFAGAKTFSSAIVASLSGNASTATAPASGTAHGAVTLNSSGNFQSVAPSTAGNVLYSNGTDWVSQSGINGTVTSTTFTGDGTVLSSTPSSAVTTTGTLTAALKTQTANTVLAGPTSGSAAAPTFRAIINNDITPVVQTKTTTYGALVTDDVILVSAASPWTLSLYTAVGNTGKTLKIIRTDNAPSNAITLAGASSQTINGLTSPALYTQHESLTIVSDGANWQVIDHNTMGRGTPYTPTVVGMGTVTASNFVWWRIGSMMRVRGSFTTGTPTAVTFTLSLPTGTTIDFTSGGLNAGNSRQGFGWAQRLTPSVPPWGDNNAGIVFTDGSDASNVFVGCANSASATAYTKTTGSSWTGAVSGNDFDFMVPIAGWW